MLTVEFIRANLEKVKEATRNKNREADFEKIITLDDKRKELIQNSQKLREERNIASKQKPTPEVIEKGKKLKEDLKKIEEELTTLENELSTLLSFVPNVPLDEVPVGKDETGNKEVKTWGNPPKFSFTPKSHIELGELLDIIDFERGSKVSGFRGYFLKNEAAVLHLALMFYVFMKFVRKGYTPLIAPTIVKEFAFFGTAQFPWGKEEVYKTNDDDAYLSGTAEVPVTAFHSGEFIPEEELPKKYVAFSPCYRKEAGAYGKDTKGLYRVHEFWKVEQVVISKDSIEEAKNLHEELQKNTEEILQELKLPYRQLLMCTGDMGEPQVKKYDTEVWIPSRNEYGEVASNSIMGDYQARRLKIKYRKKDGSTEVCYTLNDTAVASPRLLIGILENYQNEDGSITIPEVLRALTGFSKIEKK